MAFRYTRVGSLIDRDIEAAHAAIRGALRKTKGHRRLAAKRLGVSESTLKGWIRRLNAAGLADVRDGVYPKGRLRAERKPEKVAQTK